MAALIPATRRRPARLALLWIAAMLALLLTSAYAQERHGAGGATLEHSVKAAFLYKFTSYVEWPGMPAADHPLVIGVIGADEIARELEQLAAGRTVNDRPVQVRRLAEDASLENIHVLFIGHGYRRPPGPLLRRAQQEAVLTITESEEAFMRGSVINFKLVDGRVRFDVSLPAAERTNLRLSSRLLAVAHDVRKNAQ